MANQIEHFDAVVVGLGPGGEEVAGRLAKAGLSVLGIDHGLVGGECPYWGCIPSKMMVRASDMLAETRRANQIAGTAGIVADWSIVAQRIRQEATDSWDDTVAVRRLEAKGAQFQRGSARLIGPNTVQVGERTVEADRALVIASGSSAWAPPIPGLEGTPFWTNRDAIEAESLPRSLLVLGGGAIGVELAQVFHRFGAQVTVIEVAKRLLALEEPESSSLLESVFAGEGIGVVTAAKISRIDHRPGTFTVSLEDGSALEGDRLLVATGRRPDLAGLGVSAIGLSEDARSIQVDPYCRVLGDGGRLTDQTWALGDITGEGAFTHISMYQAGIVVADILSGDRGGTSGPGSLRATKPSADYRAVPRVTFTDPEIGSVGLSEAGARALDLTVRVGISQIPASSRGWIHKVGNAGFLKLIEDVDRGLLVGATSAGPTGGEVLAMFTLAIHAEVPTEKLRSMIYAYPTFHRSALEALADLKSL